MKTEPSPWQLFGLNACDTTLAELKSAYARLLKVTRPDRDPEGFMRLRAAYDEALQQIKQRTTSDKSDTASDHRLHPTAEYAKPQESAAPSVLPPAVLEAISLLRQAVSSKARQKVRIAWAAYEEARVSHPSLSDEVWELFIDAFSGQMDLLAGACTDDFILARLRLNDLRLLRLVSTIWSAQGEAKRLDEFCVSLSRQRNLSESETGAHAMVVAALALGPWSPDLASRLAQRAFPRLPTTQRGELTALVDRETMIGRLVGPLPATAKPAWIFLLRHGDRDRPWKEIVSREMLITLLRHCGPQWPGFGLLAQCLKPQSWSEMKSALEMLLR
jgi:hypothetical protein